MQLIADFEKTPEGYIAIVGGLPGANTQGSSLEDARKSLRHAVAQVLASNPDTTERSLDGRDVIREPFHPSAA